MIVQEATGNNFVSPGINRKDNATVYIRGSRYRNTVLLLISLLESSNNWLIFYIKYFKDFFFLT